MCTYKEVGSLEKPMVVIVDYEAGNLFNVGNALAHLGFDYEFSADPDRISTAERVILPGVGSAPAAMRSLREAGLDAALRGLQCPLLGICLGMQLLFERSEEEDCAGLGVVEGTVRRIAGDRLKVPHVGWNTVEVTAAGRESALFKGLPREEHFYFVHSYCAPVGDEATLAVAEYGESFGAAVRRKNFWGVQFHPERSGENGLRLLGNFLEAAPC